MFVNKNKEKEKGNIFWRIKYNTLKLELDQLKEAMQSSLYKSIIKQLNVPQELNKYKEENKRLRLKIKLLKEEIEELHGKVKKGK